MTKYFATTKKNLTKLGRTWKFWYPLLSKFWQLLSKDNFWRGGWPLTCVLNQLTDCSWTRTQDHLVRKRTLNHLAKLANLAKWLSVRLQTKWSWVRFQLQSLKFQILRLLWGRCPLTFRQLGSFRVHSETRTWHDKSIQSSTNFKISLSSLTSF